MAKLIDLSGVWQLKSSEWEDGKTIAAELPGDNYSALLANQIIPDPYYGKNELLIQEYRKHDWTFFRDFELSAADLEFDSIYFNIEMLDTIATISINGKKVIAADNMFRRYRPEVKKYLVPGSNRIRIDFKAVEPEGAKIAETLAIKVKMNDGCQVADMNLVRKVHCHGGWDWGITMAVCGCYLPLTLNGVNRLRIDHVYTAQTHQKNSCTLTAFAEVFALCPGRHIVTFAFDGQSKTVNADLTGGINVVKTVFEVKHPKLWWPNGCGEQYLYDLSVVTPDETVTRQIGLRSLTVVNQKDEYGTSMTFRVNGRDIFAKGANWIPCDAFISRQTPEKMNDLLDSACLANMNMLRVWGGGQYEFEEFYRLCDQKGIMIWQDMMFACSLYPSNLEFVQNVTAEIEYQVKRLRHHACIALWCGDNEVIGAARWSGGDKDKVTLNLINYDRLNREIWKTVEACDPERIFWPSSPCGGPNNFNDGWHDDTCGDMHYWEVWHGAKDFNAFYAVKPRFCSEFGYQSFPSLETVKTFCLPDEFNVFSPVMDYHQKCAAGNAPIIGMFGKYFRMPESFEHFLYLSQVQQAVAIKTGVEYWRSLMPRCMGTLYWQLNDNWPVASWSSIEYGGKWKQLQYHAKRFYAPVMSTLFNTGDGRQRLYTVSDLPGPCKVQLQVCVYDFEGKMLASWEFAQELKNNSGCSLKVWEPDAWSQFDPSRVFVEIDTLAVTADGRTETHQNTAFLSPYKHCDIQKSQIKVTATRRDKHWVIALATDKPAFFVTLDAPGVPGIFSDNSVTLLPGIVREIRFTPKANTNTADLASVLTVCSLRDTYC